MRRFAAVIGVLVLFPVIGTVGFRLCEGWPWIDCAYYAVIIMTTVGLSTRPDLLLGPATKIFIIFYLMAGIGIFSYCVSVLGQSILSLQLRGLMERRRMDREIDRMRDHYIICGYGRMGQTIAQHLHSRQRPFVIIDNNAARMESVSRERGWLYIVGDATDDEVLSRGGIVHAKSLASVLPTDADNVYVVLSARLLNGQLQIIARASDEKAIEKMERAGANRVVSPFSSGATKMARFMLNPSVEDFLEVTDEHGSQLELADIQVSETSSLAGKSLRETSLGERGVMIIGIRRANGERLMPPPSSAVIQPGDSLFAFGSSEAVNAMIVESA
jgi:voltage-gated potassium channel